MVQKRSKLVLCEMESSTFGQSLFSRPFLQDGGFVDPKTDREIPWNEFLKVSHTSATYYA